ncbi:MAG: penicillin-binding protein activator LpoB [Spirochaetaceae bacterium]
MKRITILGVSALLVLFLAACATPSRSVERTAADTTTDLSGRWNDTDSRLVAEEMIGNLLSSGWLSNFNQDEDRKPVVIVGNVRNLSSEHIDTTPFIKDIERELINSGRVTFVADAEEREQIREERLDQQTEARSETIKRLGEETGADYMLRGTITSQTDAVEGKRAVLYQVDLELIDIETNEKAWINTKKIKKVIEQRRTRW